MAERSSLRATSVRSGSSRVRTGVHAVAAVDADAQPFASFGGEAVLLDLVGGEDAGAEAFAFDQGVAVGVVDDPVVGRIGGLLLLLGGLGGRLSLRGRRGLLLGGLGGRGGFGLLLRLGLCGLLGLLLLSLLGGGCGGVVTAGREDQRRADGEADQRRENELACGHG